jgi:hypothetical protein
MILWIVLFNREVWLAPQYHHQGYLILPKEEALEFSAAFSKEATIVTYAADDDWAVTYNFFDTKPTFRDIQGERSNSWDISRWIGFVLIEFILLLVALILMIKSMPNKWTE